MTNNTRIVSQRAELKPCPFCGDATGPHAELVTEGGEVWGVHCPNGQCPTFGCWVVKEFSEAEAIAAWNTRSTPPVGELAEKLLYWRGSLTARAEEFREVLSQAAAVVSLNARVIEAALVSGQRVRGAAAEIAEIVLTHIATGTGPCDAACFEPILARFEEETLALSRDGEREAMRERIECADELDSVADRIINSAYREWQSVMRKAAKMLRAPTDDLHIAFTAGWGAALRADEPKPLEVAFADFAERRAAMLALATPKHTREAAQDGEARELLRQAMNALACSDKNDPLETIADNGMTVWDGMRAESKRLWPKVTALLATKDLIPESNAGVREAIAWIVDPIAWRVRERQLTYAGIKPEDPLADPARYETWHYRTDLADGAVASSLAKADEILSLLPASIDVGLRIAADKILALDQKSPRDLGLVRQTHANGTLGGIRHCAWIIRDSCGSGPFAADVVGKAREALAADAILGDLRNRKLLKYLFAEEPDTAGAYGHIEHPIDLETQREIALSLARTALASLTGEGESDAAN